MGADAHATFDDEHWERSFRERELAQRERERSAARWRSPLVVAILAAAVAAGGNAFVAYTNNDAQRKLDAQQSEEARILVMIKTGNTESAAANLRFLLQAGLITDAKVRHSLKSFLDHRRPGTGPSLPTSNAPSVVSRFEGLVLHAYRDPANTLTIGSDHAITPTELRTGVLVIRGKRVPWRNGITRAQSIALLDQDLAPTRRVVDSLVTVKLTKNQRDALTSFVFNVGRGAFANSALLRALNAGHYDQVPRYLLAYDRAGGQVLPGLRSRRQAEAALWNKR
jgi:GH24 family phage-related lysozyme (muramidase)